MTNKWTVAVIGGCGRVGLPFSLVNANAGNSVVAIDLDVDRINSLYEGEFPFKEKGGKEALFEARTLRDIHFSNAYDAISRSNVVVVVIGTPVDGEGNPRVNDIISCFKNEIIPRIQQGTLVILRSTVAPGTTELIKNMIEKERGWEESFDFTLVFAPERVSEGHGLEETRNLPQIIGAFNHTGFAHAANYFKSINDKKCQSLSVKESELAKLLTNMYRYVNFAFANEFYMLANQHECDPHKIIKAANYEYPRMDCPLPGFAGGACLSKDGKFLVSKNPFIGLIKTAFEINEGLPAFVYQKIERQSKIIEIKKVALWGMAFKKDCDDTRLSLSFKMKKILEMNNIEYVCYDPEIKEFQENEKDLIDCNYHVIMVPHSKQQEMYNKYISTFDVVVDVWDVVQDFTTNGILI